MQPPSTMSPSKIARVEQECNMRFYEAMLNAKLWQQVFLWAGPSEQGQAAKIECLYQHGYRLSQ